MNVMSQKRVTVVDIPSKEPPAEGFLRPLRRPGHEELDRFRALVLEGVQALLSAAPPVFASIEFEYAKGDETDIGVLVHKKIDKVFGVWIETAGRGNVDGVAYIHPRDASLGMLQGISTALPKLLEAVQVAEKKRAESLAEAEQSVHDFIASVKKAAP
jgi:hypothetical protein